MYVATSRELFMKEVIVSVFARTDKGMRRSGNEDAFVVADLTTGRLGLGPAMSTHQLGERGSLLAVSDGMGGAVAGELASDLAVNAMREVMMYLPLTISPSKRLEIAANIANERIRSHVRRRPQLSGMGATLTAVLIQGTTATIAQIGDSRAYLIRRTQIMQLTKDQSLAQMMKEASPMAPAQSRVVPRNVILQALGPRPEVRVALAAITLCRDDQIVICSDGLTNKVSGDEIRQTVQNSQNLIATCRRLVEIANLRGGEDNITVIVSRFDGAALYTASEGKSISAGLVSIEEFPFDGD
jgi:serine/threonine protein phosphatase PrpC